jgi:Protein of unknown function (DUF3108)
MVVTMPRIVPKFLLLALAGGFYADAQPTASSPNAGHLKTGQFVYRTVIHGKEAGNSEISVHKLPDSENFVYTNRVSGAFSQQWEAIATPTFTPISARLTFGEGEKLRKEFELKYQDGRVTGRVSGKANIDVQMSTDTVDQRIDWAAAISQDLAPGREFAFHVFDPGTGVSRVTGHIGGPEMVSVPAGTFEAVRIVYRIEKARGTEVYQILTNRDGPRMALKEEFPNGTVSELVQVSE